MIGVCLALTTALPVTKPDPELAFLSDVVDLVQTAADLFPESDDEKTVESEVDAAIQHDVNLDDIGETSHVSDGGSEWAKEAKQQIAAMSQSEINKVKSAESDDKITAKLEADVKEAKANMQAPNAKKEKQLEIDKEATAALKDPKNAKALQDAATEAELEMQSGAEPVSLIDEHSPNENEDIGEDDDDEFGTAGLNLMGGSDADVMKQINAQIGAKVSNEIGNIPTNTMDTPTLKKLQEDKAQAEQFLDTRQKSESVAAKIKDSLIAAKKAMASAEEASRVAEKSEEGHEENSEDEDEDEDEDTSEDLMSSFFSSLAQW